MSFEFPPAFDPQPSLEGDGLKLSPIRESDRAALTQAAGDPLIWAGHPANNRHEAAIFGTYFDTLLASRSGLIIRDSDDRVIGCSVYYTDTNAPLRLSIGFTFLVRDHWGGGTNRIVKGLMLGHLFNLTTEVWFHIAPTNIRSQTATVRLGAIYMHADDVDLGGGAQRWNCYCLTRENWNAVLAAGPVAGV